MGCGQPRRLYFSVSLTKQEDYHVSLAYSCEAGPSRRARNGTKVLCPNYLMPQVLDYASRHFSFRLKSRDDGTSEYLHGWMVPLKLVVVPIVGSLRRPQRPARRPVDEVRDSPSAAEQAAAPPYRSCSEHYRQRLSIRGRKLWCHRLTHEDYERVCDATDYASSG